MPVPQQHVARVAENSDSDSDTGLVSGGRKQPGTAQLVVLRAIALLLLVIALLLAVIAVEVNHSPASQQQQQQPEGHVAAAIVPPSSSGFGILSRVHPSRRILNIRHLLSDKCGDSTFALPANAPVGSLVIDVGANVGEEFTHWGEAGMRVIAFEATPGKIPMLRALIAASPLLTSNVRLVHAAVSNFTGTADFTVNDGEEGSQQDAFAAPWTSGQKVPVDVVQLDSFVDPTEHITLLKVDTQGHELQVLRGASQLLAERRIDLIHVEFSPNLIAANLHGAEPVWTMLDLLYAYGYQCFDCDEAYGSPKTRPSAFEEFATTFPDFEHRGTNHGGWNDLVCF